MRVQPLSGCVGRAREQSEALFHASRSPAHDQVTAWKSGEAARAGLPLAASFALAPRHSAQIVQADGADGGEDLTSTGPRNATHLGGFKALRTVATGPMIDVA